MQKALKANRSFSTVCELEEMHFRELLLLCSYVTCSPLQLGKIIFKIRIKKVEDTDHTRNKPAENKTAKSNKEKMIEDLKKWDVDLLFSQAIDSYLSFGFNNQIRKFRFN